jgi:N,N'-diacetylchitobiose transport system permease protein
LCTDLDHSPWRRWGQVKPSCGPDETLTVTLPLIAPGLVATAIFGFIQAWNEYTLALVVMDRPEKETLPLWLQGFNKGARGTDWGGVMAGSTLITAPVIVFFMFVQRRVVSGLTVGAVKG